MQWFAGGFGVNLKSRRIENRSQMLGTYFHGDMKPTRVTERSDFSLFYRSRAVWTCLQVVFFGALAWWTIKNYVAVIKSL